MNKNDKMIIIIKAEWKVLGPQVFIILFYLWVYMFEIFQNKKNANVI